MRLLQIMPQRWRRLVDESLKFGAIGAVNTVVDFAIFNAILMVGPLKAKIVATVISTTSSYFMNRHWTFASRERTSVRREYVLFFALNVVGLLIQLAVIAPAKYGLHFTEHGSARDRIAFNVANALSIGVAMVFRFWSYRTFVFRQQVETSTAAVASLHQRAAAASVDPASDQFTQLTMPLEVELEIDGIAESRVLVPPESTDG